LAVFVRVLATNEPENERKKKKKGGKERDHDRECPGSFVENKKEKKEGGGGKGSKYRLGVSPWVVPRHWRSAASQCKRKGGGKEKKKRGEGRCSKEKGGGGNGYPRRPFCVSSSPSYIAREKKK